MAEKSRPSIGNSVSYSIGGRDYSASDISRLKPSQTRHAKTRTEITQESKQQVQSQTQNFNKGYSGIAKNGIQSEVTGSPRTVESIKTGANREENQVPYRPQVQPPPLNSSQGEYKPQAQDGYKPGGNFRSGENYNAVTDNIRTKSSISGEAIRNVQNQTAAYQKTGAYNKQPDTIRDKVDKSPENVVRVQTGYVRQGAHTSLFDAINQTRNRPISISGSISMTAGKAEAGLSEQGDLGSQAAGTAINAGFVGVQTFKAAQTVTEAAPAIIKTTAGGLYSAGKGVYQVALTGGLAAVAVSRTASFVQAGCFNPLSHASMQMLKAQALSVGLNKTPVAQGIIHAVNGAHTILKNGIKTAGQVGRTIQTGYHVVQKGVTVVKGVANGTVSAKVITNAVSGAAKKAVNLGAAGIKTGVAVGLKAGKTAVVKGVTKGIPFIAFKGIPKTVRFLHSGIPTVAGIMGSSNDWAISGAGKITTGANIGVRTAVKGVKATGYIVKTAVKGGVNAGKAVFKMGRFIKNNGLQAAWKAGRKKAAQKTAQAGKSIVNAIINLVKAAGKKVVIPLLLIVVVVMGFNDVITVPITAVASIFGSVFSTKDEGTDYEVREYLNTIIPGLSTTFQKNLANQMAASQNTHNIVRFYANTGSGNVVEPTLAGIASVFPTNEELLNMVQPIFNVAVLENFELEPTEAEAKTLTKEIFSKLFMVTTAETTEYCGQDLTTGEGTPRETHSCGEIHAYGNCPNPVTGTHSNYTCSSCCYYYCPGHDDSWTDDEGNYHSSTSYCSGCEFACSGYTYCGGHSVISYTFSVDGIYRLEAEYFLDPIETLSNRSSRTDDEERKLQELKDYHEIFQEMMTQVSINYGGGLTMADLSGVVFINGTRTGNQSVIDLALSQVGQTGGQPYWSYYGFGSRVEWCACFVHWCMRNTSSATNSYPTTSNNAYCPTLSKHFIDVGQWGDRTFTNLVAGDTIFFDWQGDGHADHIGLVIGTDGTNVYTVEGNSGDAVKLKSYPAGSSVIYGYGLMNY